VLSNRILLIAALAVCCIGWVKVSQAFNPQPDPPGFGPIGMLPASQYAQLNVTNVGISGTPIGGTCEVELSWADAQGRTLKRSMVTLPLGKSTSLQLTAADLAPATTDGATPGPRVELLPVVQRGGLCFLASSIEVIGTATGQTSVYAAQTILTR
jgi:hypothetical protein